MENIGIYFGFLTPLKDPPEVLTSMNFPSFVLDLTHCLVFGLKY